MGKYFIKKHCEASELLPIGKDSVQDYYYGNHPLGGYVSRYSTPRSFEVEQYGFNSIEDTTPLFQKMQKAAEEETARGQWKVTIEIVEVN